MKPYVFGVDIGGTTVKLGLFTTDGTLKDKWEIRTRTEKRKILYPTMPNTLPTTTFIKLLLPASYFGHKKSTELFCSMLRVLFRFDKPGRFI